VWRAATRVDASELQPTGPRQLGRATRIFQEQTETGRGGNCSPHKIPALLRTHSCRNWQRLSGACSRTLLLIADVLFEVVPGICPVPGLRHFGERRLGKEVQTTFGGCLLHAQALRTPKRGYEGDDASFSSRLTTRTCPRSLWRSNDIRRTSQIATGNPPGGTP
jgi:hypothetical protein